MSGEGEDGNGGKRSAKDVLTPKRIAVIAVVLAVAGAGLLSFWDLNGGSLDPSDRQAVFIVSGSMDGDDQPYEIETVPIHSVVMIKHVHATAEDLKDKVSVGDVISFDYMGKLTVHRVIAYSDDGTAVTAHGDARPEIDTQQVKAEDIQGVVVGVSEWMGSLVHFVKSSPILFVALVAVVMVAAYSVRDIICILMGKG